MLEWILNISEWHERMEYWEDGRRKVADNFLVEKGSRLFPGGKSSNELGEKTGTFAPRYLPAFAQSAFALIEQGRKVRGEIDDAPKRTEIFTAKFLIKFHSKMDPLAITIFSVTNLGDYSWDMWYFTKNCTYFLKYWTYISGRTSR